MKPGCRTVPWAPRARLLRGIETAAIFCEDFSDKDLRHWRIHIAWRTVCGKVRRVLRKKRSEQYHHPTRRQPGVWSLAQLACPALPALLLSNRWINDPTLFKRKGNARDDTTNRWQGPSRKKEPFVEASKWDKEKNNSSKEPKSTTMRSTLEQAGGSVNQRWETCRLRRHRPRPRIGNATIGRQEVGIPGFLHGLTTREKLFSQIGPVSVGRETNFPTTDGRCRQNAHSHDTFVHVQRITERTAQMFSLTQHAWLKNCTHWCLVEGFVIHAQCLTCCRTCHRTLLHDLSHQHNFPSDHLLSHCLSYLCPFRIGLWNTLRDPRRSGGYTKSASPIGYETKITQSDDSEARVGQNYWNRSVSNTRKNSGMWPSKSCHRRYKGDWKIWCRHALRQIKDITEDVDEFGKVGVEMSFLQSKIHSDFDSAESIADSDLEDGELRKNAGLTAVCMHMDEETIMGSSQRPVASGKPEGKSNAEERGQVHNVLELTTLKERAWCQIHLKSHERLGNRMHCFHQRATNQEISSKVLCSNMLIRLNLEDLVLTVIKITCSVRRDLNLWDTNIKLDLLTAVSVSFSNKVSSRIWIAGRSPWICWISKRTSSTTRRIVYERQSSLEFSNPKYARNGRN